MKIEFDPGNVTELLAVAALIEVLRGESPAIQATAPAPAIVPPPPVTHVTTPIANIAPVAVVAPVPVTPVIAPTAPAGVDVDAEGLPWDKRIHSTPATKKADGVWRSKRNLDAAVKTAVSAELRQVMAAPAPAAPVGEVAEEPAPLGGPTSSSDNGAADAATAFGGNGATTAVEPAPVVVPPPPVPAAPVPPPPVPAAPVPPPPAPAPTPPVGGPVANFADLMRKITGLQTAGLLTVEGTKQISESLGITGVRDLMHRPDLIPSFDALLPEAA